ELAARWRRGLADVASAIDAIRAGVEALNPAWDSPGWASWTLPATTPSVVRFGEVRIDLDTVPRGRPRDDRLTENVRREFVLPALLHFPDRANMLVEVPWAARGEAIRVVQAAVMRLLTSLPPGKARLSIIDPVGLGSEFGAFLQLSDFDAVISPVRTDP